MFAFIGLHFPPGGPFRCRRTSGRGREKGPEPRSPRHRFGEVCSGSIGRCHWGLPRPGRGAAGQRLLHALRRQSSRPSDTVSLQPRHRLGGAGGLNRPLGPGPGGVHLDCLASLPPFARLARGGGAGRDGSGGGLLLRTPADRRRPFPGVHRSPGQRLRPVELLALGRRRWLPPMGPDQTRSCKTTS